MATTNRGAQQRPLRTCRSIGRRDGRQRTDRCKLLVPERKCEKGIGTPHTTLSGNSPGPSGASAAGSAVHLPPVSDSCYCIVLVYLCDSALLFVSRYRTAYGFMDHAGCRSIHELRCSMATMAMPANWSRLARRGSSRVTLSPGGARTPDPVGVAARRSTDYAGPPDLIHVFICGRR